MLHLACVLSPSIPACYAIHSIFLLCRNKYESIIKITGDGSSGCGMCYTEHSSNPRYEYIPSW